MRVAAVRKMSSEVVVPGCDLKTRRLWTADASASRSDQAAFGAGGSDDDPPLLRLPANAGQQPVGGSLASW